MKFAIAILVNNSGHAFRCDTLAEAVREARLYLTGSLAEQGDWCTILGADGNMRRWYRRDARGLAQRLY